ncbi:XF1762 family protein [Edwardsiella piscicida]|uniref:XF1762 family protein n=1 Tax=Edwardsiella piscicida TaxID=1263550 RepID=UPI00370DC13C
MQISPITLRSAQEFVAQHHRHNKPPRGHKFSIGLKNEDGELIGVATAGRPVARHFDDGLTLEVNRTCTTGERNANSALYGAIWRAARAMGYQRCITYTQADESGASLRAAGFVRVKELPVRKGWADSSVSMKNKRDPVGNGGVPRVLWEIRRGL